MPTLAPTPAGQSATNAEEDAARVSLGHAFYFPSLGVSESLLHPPPEATGIATLLARALVLRFWAGPDYLRFELDRMQLLDPVAWAAPYALRCAAQPLAPARVCYRYARAARSTPVLLKLSDASPQLAGNVTITAYDACRHLLSGYYEVRAPNQPDPTRATTPADPTCTILLAGDFDNVKLRQ